MGWKTITYDRMATHLNDRTDGHYVQGRYKIQGSDNVYLYPEPDRVRQKKKKKSGGWGEKKNKRKKEREKDYTL